MHSMKYHANSHQLEYRTWARDLPSLLPASACCILYLREVPHGV